MESSKNPIVSTSEGQLKLSKQVNTDQYACYFNLYQTSQHETFCLLPGPQNRNQKYGQLGVQRILECAKCLDEEIGFRKFNQKCQVMIQNKKNLVLVYRKINGAKAMTKMVGKLSQNQITSLAIFLISIVSKIKDSNAYFGSFFPDRIYQIGQEEFCLIGGQMFGKKCTSTEFLNKKQGLKAQFVTKWKYQPPEMYFPQGKLNYASDLFVIGCILYEVITGEYPFDSQKDLIEGSTPSKSSFSELTKEICKRMLQVQPNFRAEPEDLLHLLSLERGKAIFNTCKLSFNLDGQTAVKPTFFNNFQQFIMKCTTQTEGWFLYYCENSFDKPDQKYLELILNKIAKKNDKINKLAALIQKCSMKPVKEQNIPIDEDNSCSMLKMGVLIFNLLRKIPLETVTTYHNTFTKVSSKMATKHCENKLIPILFKVIAFKISLGSKFPELNGNFYLNVEGYERLSSQSLEYLSQYSLKVLNYLKKFSEEQQFQNLKEFQNTAITVLCDEVYDAISILLFALMAMKKDNSLKISNRQEIPQATFKKIDAVCAQITGLIGKLCSVHPIFSCHQIYSINSDYYEYQEQLCLMYQPISTSYEYFYLDKNHYKGIQLPTNYAQLYIAQEKEFFGDFEEQNKYGNRKPMLGRMPSLKQIEDQKLKSSTNSHKASVKAQTPNMKSQGSNVVTRKEIVPQTQKKISHQNEVKEFQQFLTTINVKKQQNNTSNTTNPTFSSGLNTNSNVKSNQNNKSMDMSWVQSSENDLFSYEWLKRTEKIMTQHFEKPELDSVIYQVYEEICKGLKLQELIEMLGKNKKVIVDPNEVLFQKVIGSGSAGQVYIGKYRENIVAIKKVKTSSNPNALKEFEREVMTYIKIKSHPSLVSLVGLTKFNQDYFLLTEFCEGGSLFDLLHKRVNQITLTWSERISIALDIARGMEILHFMNPPVIHRDLKSLNVFMVKRNGKWMAKVADFGLSRSPDTDMMTSALGTLHWMAPELLCNKQYSLKVDVYSFAVVLWQICTRKTPYHNIPNQMGIVKHVVLEKGRPLLQLLNQDCPKELTGLMTKCWSEDPEARPFFPQIITELQKIKL